MDLGRKLQGLRGRESINGPYNVWRVRSTSSTACEFPSPERIKGLGDILGDAEDGNANFLGIEAQDKKHLLLRIRSGTSSEALDEFLMQVGNDTVSIAKIFVITHDGRLPREGGKRFGFMIEGSSFFYPLGGGVVELAQQRKQVNPRNEDVAVVPPPPPYASLPRAAFHDGECPYCYHHPNTRKMIYTSEGPRDGYECSNCGTLMRPQF